MFNEDRILLWMLTNTKLWKEICVLKKENFTTQRGLLLTTEKTDFWGRGNQNKPKRYALTSRHFIIKSIKKFLKIHRRRKLRLIPEKLEKFISSHKHKIYSRVEEAAVIYVLRDRLYCVLGKRLGNTEETLETQGFNLVSPPRGRPSLYVMNSYFKAVEARPVFMKLYDDWRAWDISKLYNSDSTISAANGKLRIGIFQLSH